MSAYKEWLAENVDSLAESWAEHLSNMSMRQAGDHVARLAKSDEAFAEYCAGQYIDRLSDDGPEPDDGEGA